jgi:transcriptional regulator with XRE-family HTH domain
LDPPEDAFANVGGAIKEERQFQSLSRKALADEVGITDRTLAQYEENLKDIPKSILVKISETFGMHWASFLDKYNLYDDDVPDGFNSPEEYEKAKEQSEIVDQKEMKQRQKIGFNDFTYAMYNGSQELTEENKQKLLEMARFFKEQQDKEKSKK